MSVVLRKLAGSSWLALVLSAWACGHTSSDSCSQGAEKCACYPNHTCDAGLACYSGVCVIDPTTSSGGTSSSGGSAGEGGSNDSGATGSAGGPEGGATNGSGGRGGTGSGGRPSGGTSSGGATSAGEAGAGGDASGAPSGGTSSGGAASGGAASGGRASGGSAGSSSGGAGSGGATTGGASSGGAGGCGTAGGSYLFYDGFECGTSFWTPQPTTAFTLVTDGSTTYERGTLAASLAVAVAGSNWTRITVEARVKVLSFASKSSSDTFTNYVAVYAGYIDANNYNAVAWQGDGTVALKYRQNGGGADSSKPDPVLTLGTWHTLAIDLSGATTTIYLDGVMMQSTLANAPIPAGRVALGVYNATARFDDVVVRSN